MYENHNELFLLPHPQLELHQDLYLQMSLRQIPTNIELLLLFGSILPPWIIESDNYLLLMNFLCNLICTHLICTRGWHTIRHT
jgi:hypothetical protein